MKILFAPIFLSLILLSPVFLRPGFNQWVAGEARSGKPVLESDLLNVRVSADRSRDAGDRRN